MTTIRRIADFGAVFLLGLLAACAAELSPPKAGGEAAPTAGVPATTTAAPAEEAEAEPETLADAEALLEKARRNLDRLALNEPVPPPATAAGVAAPSAPRAQSTPAPAPPRDEAKRADKSASSADGAAAPPAKEVNTCETACKAFSSLARASDAVCRLDTDGGKHCERARQIRLEASHRVASCGCAK